MFKKFILLFLEILYESIKYKSNKSPIKICTLFFGSVGKNKRGQ